MVCRSAKKNYRLSATIGQVEAKALENFSPRRWFRSNRTRTPTRAEGRPRHQAQNGRVEGASTASLQLNPVEEAEFRTRRSERCLIAATGIAAPFAARSAVVDPEESCCRTRRAVTSSTFPRRVGLQLTRSRRAVGSSCRGCQFNSEAASIRARSSAEAAARRGVFRDAPGKALTASVGRSRRDPKCGCCFRPSPDRQQRRPRPSAGPDSSRARAAAALWSAGGRSPTLYGVEASWCLTGQ